jgi:hypothetical protein
VAAPKNLVDVCFLCGSAPCECNKTAKKSAKKAARPRKDAKPKPSPVGADDASQVTPNKPVLPCRVRTGVRDAMKASASPSRVVSIGTEVHAAIEEEQASEIDEILADADMVLAIQYLSPLLAADEKLKYRRVLEEDTTKLRAKAWRERRNESMGRVQERS